MKIRRRTLSVVLEHDQADKVEEQATTKGVSVDTIISDTLKHITNYKYDDVVFCTIAVDKSDYQTVQDYADEQGLKLSNEPWILDELIGRGVEHLKREGTPM